MKRKKDLDKGIYIEDDLTKKEREIQMELWKIAHKNRKEEKRVKIGYYKLCVDGKWSRWNERRGKLLEERERN